MNCNEMERYYELYLDGELDVNDMRNFELHLGSCPTCSMAVGREKLFRHRIGTEMAEVRAPGSLRSAILSRTVRQARVFAFRNYAVAVSVVAVIGAGIPVFMSVTRPAVVIDEDSTRVLQAHMKSSDSEIYGGRQAIQGFVKARAPFPARIPVEDSDSRRLIGARLTSLGDRPAVIYLYDVGGRRFSVAQYLKSSPDIPDALSIRKDGEFTVATCPQGDVVQTVVGKGGSDTVRQFIPVNCSF